MPYVVTLLCTLGAFSIYSVLIVGRSISSAPPSEYSPP
jgi:hypothetical protein